MRSPDPQTIHTSGLKHRPAIFLYGFCGSFLVVYDLAVFREGVGAVFGAAMLAVTGVLTWRLLRPWRLELTRDGFALLEGDWPKTRRAWSDIRSLRLKRYRGGPRFIDPRRPILVWFGNAYVVEYEIQPWARGSRFGGAPQHFGELPAGWELSPHDLLHLMSDFHAAYGSTPDVVLRPPNPA